jgi:hypothetical protein
MTTFKKQIIDMVKLSNLNESEISKFELSKIDSGLDEAAEIISSQTINKLFKENQNA